VQYEAACHRICDAIATLLEDLRDPACGAVFAAASATRSLSAAMHHAAGNPQSARWADALQSVDEFLRYCHEFPGGKASIALRELRGFVAENADLLVPEFELARAS